MPDTGAASHLACNCHAVRAAARRVTQYYDDFLAPTDLRITQFGILHRLMIYGPLTISGLAEKMAIDRTTLGRNLRPLARDGLVDVATKEFDHRVKEVSLSTAGVKRLDAAQKNWQIAQEQFETNFGPARAAELRGLLRAVTALETPPPTKFARDR